MTYQLSCPFCGVSFSVTNQKTGEARHPEGGCHMTRCVRSVPEWNMRPPKKEQPLPAVPSEVEYLRSIVERLALRNVPLSYSNSSERVDGEIYAMRGGTGPFGDIQRSPPADPGADGP